VTSAEVREKLVEALQLDLVGPGNDHVFAKELLPDPPSRWYLTGFLVPAKAPIEQRTDETSNEEIAAGSDAGGTDDAVIPDRDTARKSFLPSSMGLSVLVPPGVDTLDAVVSWGDYAYEGGTDEPEVQPVVVAATGPAADDAVAHDAPPGAEGAGPLRGYRRTPRGVTVTLALPQSGTKPTITSVPDSGGLVLTVAVRDVALGDGQPVRLQPGTRSVSVFLVNGRPPNEKRAYRAFAFQAEIELRCAQAFVPRPDLRDAFAREAGGDWDERVADLQYRDVFEFAVGHGISAHALKETDGSCRAIETTWVPRAEVERVSPAQLPEDVELRMEELGKLASADEASAKLSPLVAFYRTWMQEQRRLQGLDEHRMAIARDLLVEAEHCAARIEAGIAVLRDASVLDAFRIANRAMAQAARQREAIQRGNQPQDVAPPRWYPFQLAFILMSLPGIVDPHHNDRQVVDLLFFPTGGGKTEAYLGLAALTMVLRRLRNTGIHSAGMTVLMRYTLRLLTLDQLGRAAALICALELEREKDRGKLGEWPFEIGLWVGLAATPNRMGYQGYNGPGADYTAYRKTRANTNRELPLVRHEVQPPLVQACA
jgi:hypothetical protein